MKSYKVWIKAQGLNEEIKIYSAANNKTQAGINAKIKLRTRFGYSGRHLEVTKIYEVK